MRIRKKPWAIGELESNKYIIGDCAANKGNWAKPLHVEIGCGKGGFIVQTAALNSDINYVGIEKQPTITAIAARKARESETEFTNLAFLIADVKLLREIFDEHEVSRIYINFCDPWPKSKWAKRRLTHRDFLTSYKSILTDDGSIFFKTDNAELFEFSLNEFCQNDWKLRNITLDLHKSKWWNDPNTPQSDKLMTEYEQRFSGFGMNIYRLEAWL